eukprot:TRINITY_DN29362_c0_g1_i1.p1 TRINITY_DN29362_c0_g1~~TRINITY_DN29362_c0_g1_i1.p1  ORF type:complete len:130 (+),score=28.81 TRINITY_DN29362_c0_g1_i1:26-391(+)
MGTLTKHPDYKRIAKNTNANAPVYLLDGDIALLEIDPPFDLQNKISLRRLNYPQCLWSLPTNWYKLEAGVLLTEKKRLPEYLESIDITVNTTQECLEKYQEDGTLFADRMFCAGTPDSDDL